MANTDDLAPPAASEPPVPVLPLATRPMVESDWPYVAKTWVLHTARDNQTSRDRMAKRYNGLRTRGAQFLIACSPAHQAVILGFLCFEDFEERGTSASILHFAYTKDRYRKQGVFRSLLANAGFGPYRKILCSHWSDYAQSVRARIPVLVPLLP